MQITRNGVTVSFDDSEILRMAVARLGGRELVVGNAGAPLHPTRHGHPRIGSIIQGCTYAGVMRGLEGAPDYLLLAGPEMDGAASWDDSDKWAKGLVVEGCNDLTLPLRREQSLLFANVPELFQKEGYWSSEVHAACSGLAWAQGFDNGLQDRWGRNGSFRARSVRRIPLFD